VQLLLATHNEHKRREFARLLAAGESGDGRVAGSGGGGGGGVSKEDSEVSGGDGSAEAYDLRALPDDVQLPPEDGETFAENALGKARAAAKATGTLTIADDSGIEAAALDGSPGVRSARYAGENATDEENLRKLLREAPAGSALEYVCVIALVDPSSGAEQLFEARCSGRLASETRGERGFGYDPAFLPDDGPPGLTMAELTDEQKDAISHRGRAARALMRRLNGNRVESGSTSPGSAATLEEIDRG
jgi:XTP/dITP diphosphohydrolase